jgi:starch phosphorylase
MCRVAGKGAVAKVFCFFFSKKKPFLPSVAIPALPAEEPRRVDDHTPIARIQPTHLPPEARDPEAFRDRIIEKLTFEVGRAPDRASERDWFVATAHALRDFVVQTWLLSSARQAELGGKRVYYLSLEFLIGRLLFDAAGNLGLLDTARAALASLGVDIEHLREQEPDAALGNGGLGRLAACFMESLATLRIPAFGYGIRYEHGLFRQKISGGVQHELPEDWLSVGNPWEFERPQITHGIGFGGAVIARTDAQGRQLCDEAGRPAYTWQPAELIRAVAYDTPVVGGGGDHANTLRLWSARATEPLHLDTFNRGDHVGALRDRVRTEAVSRVLYPGDDSESGQELRLRQEFFFASASLQDLVARHLERFADLSSLPDHAAIQLNDTHPAIAIAEMMRLAVDVHAQSWAEAWRITVATFSYTNHTLLPEALETWPVSLLERLLPRHMQILYMLNAQHLERARREHHASDSLLAAVSLIDERHGRRLRMGHLAFIGSHAINGVSALHTELMRQTVFADLHGLYGGRITNKTNGITFRRWLHRANPGLTRVLTQAIGPGFLKDPLELGKLAAHAKDGALQQAIKAERLAAKGRLTRMVQAQLGIVLDPTAMFDVHIKRIHEYKRQLLNILQTVARYDSIRAQPMRDWVPRVKIFAGKAAPGYRTAKQIIRLAHDVGHAINNDPAVGDKLKLVFLPNYNVSLAEMIIPAADLSEQISTAGLEASGTGNMKLSLNGALTIGTLDGANVEISQHVGRDNIFIFGLTAEEAGARRRGDMTGYGARTDSAALAQALDAISSGVFSPDEPTRYKELVDSLLQHDRFLVTADFDSYCAKQEEVDLLWRTPSEWFRRSILNIAGMGWFSSDRTIAEYAQEIWNITT